MQALTHLPRLDPHRVARLLRVLGTRYGFDTSGITDRDCALLAAALRGVRGDRRRILQVCIAYLREIHADRHGNPSLERAIYRVEMYVERGRRK